MDADELARVVQRQQPRQPELQAQPRADLLAREHPVGDGLAHADAPVVRGLLQRAGLLQRDHHARIELLPHARHAGEHRGRDLAHVLGHRLGVLDEVEDRARVHREVLAAHALGDVAQRQEAHALVFLVLRDERVVAARGVHQPRVAVHGALGLAGGARGVDQNRQVFGPAGRHAALHRLRVARQVRSAEGAQRVQAHHARVVELAQAFHVEHDHAAQAGQAGAHFERLVELLVVFHEEHRGARVFAQVLHLRGGVGRVDAVGHTAAAEHGQVGQHPFDDGVRKNGRALAAREADGLQPGRDLAHGLGGLAPTPGAPDAQLLLPHPDVVAALAHGVPEHGRERVAGHEDVVAGFDGSKIPESLHGDGYLQVFFFFQRRSPRTPSSLTPR
ncbi:hypothetical protein D3C72_1245880 [compost metagenome]